jgi:DNA-binding MarR family transcriptional regulator
MDVESLEDAEAYVLRSKYRSNALESLASGGRATPTELAEKTDDPRPHVSRALSELQETGIVELQVSEVTNVGRYYDLTERGAMVWHNIKS